MKGVEKWIGYGSNGFWVEKVDPVWAWMLGEGQRAEEVVFSYEFSLFYLGCLDGKVVLKLE